jgi:hypothetical protein
MPNLTPNMLLPYPNGVDAPCDFDEQWCAFTSAIDGVFDTFETALARTYPAVPAAVLQVTTPVLVQNNIIPFDTVQLDTADMTDIDADPYTITIKVAGRYTLGGYTGELSVTPNPNTPTIFISVTPNDPLGAPFSTILDLGTVGLNFGNNAHFEAMTLGVGTTVQLITSNGAVSGFRSIDDAWLAVYWHADQELP